jgi:hypothetical protein
VSHSPAPWTVDQPWSGFSAIRDAEGRIVFALAHGTSDEQFVPKDDCAGNAALCAAAADLLDACEQAARELYDTAHSSGDPDDPSNMDGVAAIYRLCKSALAKAKGATP